MSRSPYFFPFDCGGSSLASAPNVRRPPQRWTASRVGGPPAVRSRAMLKRSRSAARSRDEPAQGPLRTCARQGLVPSARREPCGSLWRRQRSPFLPVLDFQLIVLDPPVSSRAPCGPAGAVAWGVLVPPVAPPVVSVDWASTELPRHRVRLRPPYTPAPSRPQVDASEDARPAPHCFTIYAAQKTIVVAAR